MMPLLFRQFAHPIHKIKRLAEIGKLKRPHEMVVVHRFPFGHDLQ